MTSANPIKFEINKKNQNTKSLKDKLKFAGVDFRVST